MSFSKEYIERHQSIALGNAIGYFGVRRGQVDSKYAHQYRIPAMRYIQFVKKIAGKPHTKRDYTRNGFDDKGNYWLAGRIHN